MTTTRIVAVARTYITPERYSVAAVEFDAPPERAPYLRNVLSPVASRFAAAMLKDGDPLAAPAYDAEGPTVAQHLARVDAAHDLGGTLRAVPLAVYGEGENGPHLFAAPPDHDRTTYQLTDRLRDLASEVLWHSGDLPSTNPQRLEKLVAYLERWLPRTIAEREQRAAALAVENHHSTLLAERDAKIADLEDHLTRESRSAQAARAVADELSAALKASRGLVADRDDHIMAIRAALGCDDGATTIVAEIERLKAEVANLRAQVKSAHATADDLRDRMADPEGMATAAAIRDLSTGPR